MKSKNLKELKRHTSFGVYEFFECKDVETLIKDTGMYCFKGARNDCFWQCGYDGCVKPHKKGLCEYQVIKLQSLLGDGK